jgi:hypothetical protein
MGLPDGADAIIRSIRRARTSDEVLLAVHHALARVQRRERVSLILGELPEDAQIDHVFPIALSGLSLGFLGIDRAPGAGPLDAHARELFGFLAREIAVALQAIAFASAWRGCAQRKGAELTGEERW